MHTQTFENIATFELDMKSVASHRDIIEKFYNTFQLPIYGNQIHENWDALNDWMIHMESDSKLISKMDPIPKHIHLIIRNFNDVDKIKNGESELSHFLTRITDNKVPEYRGWGCTVNIKFTFEVHHGDW